MTTYSYTIGEARDCLYSTFYDPWKDPVKGWHSVLPDIDPASKDKAPKVIFDGVEPADDATISQPELYVFVRHATGQQASLRGEKGRRWRRTGIMLVRIYVPKAMPLKTADALSRIVLDAFQGKRGVGLGAGITFPSVKPIEQGALKNRYLTDVLVSFEYDELI